MTIEWANVALGKVAEIQTGKLDSNQAIENGDYPFFTCAPEPLRINDYAFDCDAILLAGNNANGVFHLNRYAGKFNAYQRTYVITPKHAGQLNIKFLYYALHTLVRRLGEYSQGTATKFLTMRILSPLPVPLPSIGEQNAIACILGALDDKIELNRRMNRTLEAMARAIFQSWFVDFDPVRAKLALNGAEGATGQAPAGLKPELAALFPDRLVAVEGREVPEGWGIGTVGDIALLNPESWTKDTRPDVINYLDLSNTKWGRIDAVTVYSQQDAPSRAQRVLRPTDTIVGVVRPGNGSYAFISEDGLTGSTGFAVLRPQRPAFAEFVYLAVTNKDNIDTLAHLADGAAYPAVRPEIVSATPIVKPAADVVQAFSRLTGSMLKKMDRNERESRTLAALRDTLLPKLISGALRVVDAERIVGRCVS